MSHRLLPLLLCAAAAPVSAQTLGPDFVTDYSFLSLGSPSGVLGPLGGIEFLPTNPDILLIGGSANGPAGAIYEVPVVRDATGHITGFGAAIATVYSAAPEIDGGLEFGPNGVLFYTGYDENLLGQILPGSTVPDKVVSLSTLINPIGGSVGTLRFVPPTFAGAGSLKLASYSTNQWYDVGLTPDGNGTFDVTSVTQTASVTGGPEGIVYINGSNPGFAVDSVLISEWSAGSVGVYEIDANGDPIAGTRRPFLSGLTGAEGAVIDPKTGDFLFSTFGGGDQVIVVSGFTAIANFCQALPNSLSSGGALMGATGSVSVAAQDLFLTTNPVPNGFGIYFFSNSQTQLPLFDGQLCLDGGLNRVQPFIFAQNNTATVNIDYVGPSDSLIAPGDTWFFQYFYRDLAGGPNGANLSDGLRITFTP